ncbi:MAG: glycoside hydrolase family 5 protein [Fibrobacter sp.]|nr:glycoside hydrolase family 5 protein [Fibrobacter sp.]
MNKYFRAGAVSTMTAALICGFGLLGCSSDGGGHAAVEAPAEEEEAPIIPVDYSKGRAMNKRLGKGINLGNAWDGNSYWSCGMLRDGDTFTYTNLNGQTKEIVLSGADAAYFGNLPSERYNFGCEDRLDASWSNPIEDSYFTLLKNAGFNSVRIPVRWQHNSDPVTHKVNPERLAGVMDDIQKAIDAGLAVVVSFHWYYEIMFAANHSDKNPDLYEAEKVHYASIWTEVATALNAFPDDMVVFDILNEPTMKSVDNLNEVMTLGYQAIRAAAPGKTIMFESMGAAKFAQLSVLRLPQDGNIIYSGHYYEPYGFTHQGHSYSCNGDAAFSNNAVADLKGYVAMAKRLYPDINGGSVPMNMGEFGVSGGGVGNTSTCNGNGVEALPSAQAKARWAQQSIEAAEALDMSWHYWGLAGVGGFEAYDKVDETWYEGFPAAFGL